MDARGMSHTHSPDHLALVAPDDAAHAAVPPTSAWAKVPQLVSIVAPVFREEQGIGHFADAVVEVMTRLGIPFELILVEDDSPDGSWDAICRVHVKYPEWVKALSMSRRFGHQASLAAGFQRAQGDVVICMDSDMQHPPAMLPELLYRWSQGYQLVYTRRRTTADRSAAAELASSWFYRIMNRLSDVSFEEGTADFRLMDRVVADAVAAFHERSPVFRGLINWAGFRRTAVDFDATRRYAGASNYTWSRMLRLAIECLFAFSLLPLRFGYYLGGASLALCGAYTFWTIGCWLFRGLDVPGYTSTVVLITFMGGLNLMCMGIMGEYIGRIHEQVKGRPLYLVKDSLGWNADGNPGVIPFRTSLSPLPAWHSRSPQPQSAQRAG
jgi:dolichol-phosphate mannosyltransferase